MRIYADPTTIPLPLRLDRQSSLRGEAGHLGAFSLADTLTLTLEVNRALLCHAVSLAVLDDDSGMTRDLPLVPTESDHLWDRFSIVLPLRELTAREGLFWCKYTLETAYGRLYSDHGDLTALRVTASPHAPTEQMTVYTADYRTPDWVRRGIMYHVFVDRFARGGDVPCRSDATVDSDWDNGIPEFADVPGGRMENTTFFGGTLYGVADRMPYIASLGVRCIYLSPIFEARSNHKYDTGDYLRVDEMFGGDEGLHAVVARAADYGIRVILDGVFNHTGDDSRYFNRYGKYPPEGACDSKDSPYYPWYTFHDYPNRYRCWWDIDILPTVRSDSPEYRRFICGEVVPRWAKMGIGGWRLDVVDELAPCLVEEFRAAVKTADPEAVIYGEVWEDASNKIAYDSRRRYFRGHQIDAVMNYPLREAIVAFARDGDAEGLRETVRRLIHNYPTQVLQIQMNHLGTHDTERILNVLAGERSADHTNAELSTLRLSPEARAKGIARLRCAYVTVACLPGVPCVYYGDEVGMEGWRDPFNRLPFPWGRENQTLLSHYRRIGGLRASSRTLAEGDTVFLAAEKGSILFARVLPEETLLIAVNVGEKTQEYTFDHPCRDVFTEEIFLVGEKITIPPFDFKILRADGEE